MNLKDFLKVLRTRWVTIVATTLVTILGAVIITFFTTPLYHASTRLFVSTAAGTSLGETYQGNRYSQERVVSYVQLLTGRTLPQRTIDKLGLDMTAAELQRNIKASAKHDTVLITVEVLDESPVQARDIANTLSDEFVTMVRELETPEDGSPPSSRVVVEQRATINEQSVEPQRKRNLAAGLALGLILGIGLAVLRDLLDNTVKDRKSVEEITNHGLVGSIPFDKERRKQVAISFGDDNSAIAEAFRKLRTNLQFLSVDDPPKVIVITSSTPAEGKSTTAINLALALAEADQNVVLVDGDLRRPSLHRYLDLIGAVGFSTVLAGTSTLPDSLQKTRYPNLTVLASGSVPPNPSELLASQAAKTLLSELRAEYDYVIVDSAPLLAVTDAAILSAAADGVLMVARCGKTKRDQLASAVNNLEDVSARLLGAVLAIVPTRSGSETYRYSYYGESTSERGSATEIETTDDKKSESSPLESEPTAARNAPSKATPNRHHSSTGRTH